MVKYEWETTTTELSPAYRLGSPQQPWAPAPADYVSRADMEPDPGPLGAWQPFGVTGRDGERVVWRRRLRPVLAGLLGES